MNSRTSRLDDASRQTIFSGLAALLVALPWYWFPIPYLPVVIIAAVFVIASAAASPLFVCLGFISLSMLRVHEAYPVLMPYQLPLAAAALTIMSLGWEVLKGGLRQPFWPPQLQAFVAFFCIAMIGGVFAMNPGASFALFTSVFWKVALMTLALAWLPRTPTDFRLISRTIALAGAAVAFVAIKNKWAGLELVEGTRVTVGRSISSQLGDPNDLAFVLFIPLSFSLALLASRAGFANLLIGIVCAPTIFLAITYTQSRGGVFGLIALFAVFAVRLVRSKLVLCCLGLGAAAVFIVSMGIEQRGAAAEAGIDTSATRRLELLWGGLKIFAQHPLMGVGLGNFAIASFAQGGRWFVAHNTWVHILAETGIPGFAAFMAMIVTSFTSTIRSLHLLNEGNGASEMQATTLGLLASLAALCAAGTFLSQGFGWPLYIVVALTAALSRVGTGSLNAKPAPVAAAQAQYR